MDNLKLIDCGDGRYGAFSLLSGIMLKLNERSYHILRLLVKGGDEFEIAERLRGSYREIKGVINSVSNIIHKEQIASPTKESVLGKLQLIVTNYCNFKCRYCYADGGMYHQQVRGQMTPEVVREVFEQFYAVYHRIKAIQIFGGEPLLNWRIIDFICNYLEQKCSKKDVPKIGMNTNLSILPARMIEIIGQHDIHLCVSLDGPQEINDMLRIHRSGKGTFKTVAKNICRLKEATGQPDALEVTYTMEHVKAGLTRRDVARFLRDKFGVTTILISNVGDMGNPEGSQIRSQLLVEQGEDYFGERLQESLGLLHEGILDFEPLKILIYLALNWGSEYYCTAGINTISVMPNGDMYPCQLFCGKEKFYMGNCLRDGIFDNAHFGQVQGYLLDMKKDHNALCRNCFVKPYCHACIAYQYDKTNVLIPIDEAYCDRTRRTVEVAIDTLFSMRTNEKIWKDFISSIYKIANWVYV
ncbi:MAG: radical SAM protein [Firmicutes bacterium]|nr:radical SAM protein [Bacillota bacterium]